MSVAGSGLLFPSTGPKIEFGRVMMSSPLPGRANSGTSLFFGRILPCLLTGPRGGKVSFLGSRGSLAMNEACVVEAGGGRGEKKKRKVEK